jgi:hypothetical protein
MERLYIHQGSSFPCLEGCPQVKELPHQTVSDYLAQQNTVAGIAAQDEYLELMQRLADGAFVLLLETGLAASGDRITLRLWRELGNNDPENMAMHLGPEWIDRLMLPDISEGLNDPVDFCRQHHDMLQEQAQTLFGKLPDASAVREASGLMMGLALHLGQGLGANPGELAENWIMAAKELGALE